MKTKQSKTNTHLSRTSLLSDDNGVITDLEPDILECEVKWALESIATNKARDRKSVV